MKDFIGIYDGALSPDICQQIIRHFENSPKRQAGITGQGKDIGKKQSEDISISLESEWRRVNKFITQTTLKHVVDYMQYYSHLLTGALSPAIQDPATGKLVTLSSDHIAELTHKAIANIIARLYYFGVINAQKYRKGEGVYHHYHSEIYPSPNDHENESLHRILLFMYYLNDVNQGGETEFYYQQKFIKPKAGRLVIAPAGFTHTHKGHVPISNDKYILTSWILFQPAGYIYGTSKLSQPDGITGALVL